MIPVTFLAHSGFFVELPSASLLFDWWKGDLPPIPQDRPLLVFASHRHEDHFKREIFALDDGTRPVRFLLGKDIKLTPRNRERWGLGEETAGRCTVLGGGRREEPLPGITVETLPSTDEGAAFLVTAEGRTIFHAGDLNWWHWEGEDPAWNRNMAADFRRYIEPLRGRKIDLAMLPLDPRLGESGFLGPRTFLETADIRFMLPMHQWGDFGYTQTFLEAYPAYQEKVLPVHRDGERFAVDI